MTAKYKENEATENNTHREDVDGFQAKKIPSDFESVSSLQERLQKHLHLRKPGKVNDHQGIRKTVQPFIRSIGK